MQAMIDSMTELNDVEDCVTSAQAMLTQQLIDSGALDQIFSQIDQGVKLTGADGLIAQMLKAALERGLATELSAHLGYEKGDADAAEFPNSRNGTSKKTVSSQVGDIELQIPRDRQGTFTPKLKGYPCN